MKFTSMLASCPLLIAGLAVVFVGGLRASCHGVNQHLFAMGHRSLQHARYSSGCPSSWGRVHEVRRSQPTLSGSLILEFGASSLRTGSLTPDHASHIAWGLRATWMTASGLSHLIAAISLGWWLACYACRLGGLSMLKSSNLFRPWRLVVLWR